jgi:hypothetical protein
MRLKAFPVLLSLLFQIDMFQLPKGEKQNFVGNFVLLFFLDSF